LYLLFSIKNGFITTFKKTHSIVSEDAFKPYADRVFPIGQDGSIHRYRQPFTVFRVTPRVYTNNPAGVFFRYRDFVQHQVFRVQRDRGSGGLHCDRDIHAAGERSVFRFEVRFYSQHVRQRFRVIRQTRGIRRPAKAKNSDRNHRQPQHSVRRTTTLFG